MSNNTPPLWTVGQGEDPAKQITIVAQLISAFYKEVLRCTEDVELARQLTSEYQHIMFTGSTRR